MEPLSKEACVQRQRICAASFTISCHKAVTMFPFLWPFLEQVEVKCALSIVFSQDGTRKSCLGPNGTSRNMGELPFFKDQSKRGLCLNRWWINDTESSGWESEDFEATGINILKDLAMVCTSTFQNFTLSSY